MRQSQDIKDGMKKCKEAILLTLGKYAKFDEKIVRKVLAEPIKEREKKEKKKSSRGKSKSKSMAEVVREMNREKRKDKNLLGMSRLHESQVCPHNTLFMSKISKPFKRALFR